MLATATPHKQYTFYLSGAILYDIFWKKLCWANMNNGIFVFCDFLKIAWFLVRGCEIERNYFALCHFSRSLMRYLKRELNSDYICFAHKNLFWFWKKIQFDGIISTKFLWLMSYNQIKNQEDNVKIQTGGRR